MSEPKTYKQTIKSLSPICFLTFDGDTLINRGTGELNESSIPDESFNNNVGLLQTNTDLRKSYVMGINSLIKRETNYDENAILIAPYGYDTSGLVDFPFEKTLIEVLHNESLKLDGDYTISFLFNVTQSENELNGLQWNESTQKYEKYPYNYRSFTRTLLKKGSPIHIYINQYYGSPTTISFDFPGYSYTMNISSFPKEFYNNIWHVTLVHKIEKVTFGLYRNVRKVFINGIKYCENYSENLTVPYTANNKSPIEIGGNRDSSDPDYLNDRTTVPTYFDQIAIFDKALSDYEVINCYKRVGYYTDLILNSIPTLYIPFSDREVENTNNLKILYGAQSNWVSSYSHNYPQVTKEIVLSDNRIGMERGVAFYNSQAKVEDVNYGSNIINPTDDFTIEFWLGFTGTEPGVVMSCQNNVAPYDGILIETNKFYNKKRPGMIQLRISEGNYITAPELNVKGENVAYNDGVVRHYAFTRKNRKLTMYIDGVEVNTYETSYIPSINNGILYFMGVMPDNQFTYGSFGQFVYYERVLEPHEISARSFFNVKMIIKGKVTLQGTPFKADIRIYNHNTGNLIHEYQSNNNGEYYLNIYTNDYVDVMFMSKDDSTIQIRTIGHVLPHEYID